MKNDTYPRTCNCCKGKGMIYDGRLQSFITCPIPACKNGVVTKIAVEYEFLKNTTWGKPANHPGRKRLEEIALLV
jgi:hypothetical protein